MPGCCDGQGPPGALTGTRASRTTLGQALLGTPGALGAVGCHKETSPVPPVLVEQVPPGPGAPNTSGASWARAGGAAVPTPCTVWTWAGSTCPWPPHRPRAGFCVQLQGLKVRRAGEPVPVVAGQVASSLLTHGVGGARPKDSAQKLALPPGNLATGPHLVQVSVHRAHGKEAVSHTHAHPCARTGTHAHTQTNRAEPGWSLQRGSYLCRKSQPGLEQHGVGATGARSEGCRGRAQAPCDQVTPPPTSWARPGPS